MPLLNKCRLMEDFMAWKEYISSKFWLFFSISCLPMRTFTASLSMLVVIVANYTIFRVIFSSRSWLFFFIAHLRVVTLFRNSFEGTFVTVSPAVSGWFSWDLVHAYCTLNVLIVDCFLLYLVNLFIFSCSLSWYVFLQMYRDYCNLKARANLLGSYIIHIAYCP